MPFSKMTTEQIEAVLAAHVEIDDIPGVIMVIVEFIDRENKQPGLVVYVDSQNSSLIADLPVKVADVPVLARIEERSLMRVVRVIDPRRTEGKWPTSFASA